jgi:DNA-binding winged helix-turn-helix (wHTH) protein/tetratricopeptide (TPR) repeat protein
MSDLQFRDFTLDPSLRQLRRGDEPIALPGKAFDLLLFMASNAGRPLTKAEILDAVWPGAFVEESNLTQNVFLLRKALGEESPILTLPGRGYQFAAHVTASAGSAMQPASLSSSQPGTLEATHSRLVFQEDIEERIDLRRSPIGIAFLAAGTLLVAAVAWLGWQRYEDRVGGPPIQVVMTDLEGSTGNPALDHTLASAVRIDLNQSPFVTVVSENTVRRTLTEMMHKADDPLTASLAHDICERTGSQAVLHGSVAKLGAGFLLTEEATSCVDGSTLASDRRDASSVEALPKAIDTLTARLRHGLGESRRTVARYSVPLLDVNTGSMEALEDFSQGSELGQRGKLPEAISLLKRAVELDPNFAAAYVGLATFYGNSADRASSRAYVEKAYAVRQYANEPVQLQITSLYMTNVTQDLYQARSNYQTWAEIYPRNPIPWSGLIEVNRFLGHHAEAITAARHALALNNHFVVLYYALAMEQIHNGDLKDARSTCDLALSRGMDSDLIHGMLLRLAVLNHDDALFSQQTLWADAHPNAAFTLSGEAAAAINSGRLLDARKLIARMEQSNEQQGLGSVGVTLARDFANSWAEIGEPDDARAVLRTGQLDPEEINQDIGLVETGDAASAAEVIKTELAKHPTATLWNKLYIPWLRAQIAYSAHRPAEAITDLEPTREFSAVGLDMDYLRGLAYLDLNDPSHAEAEFRSVLSRPFVDPLAQQIPLSWLNLGRTLARENKLPQATDAYAHFFSLWSHANGDPQLLDQAHQELAKLSPPQ